MKRRLSFTFLAEVVLLLSYASGIAQSFEDRLKQDFEKHNKNRLQIYLAFNQPEYAPGDTVFYNAFVNQINGSAKRTVGRDILHLDFVDSLGFSKLHSNFLVQGNEGSNQVIIPINFLSGYYRVQVSSGQGYSTATSLNSYIVKIADQKVLNRKQDHSAIKIFVEGGSFIADVPTKIILQSEYVNKRFTILDSDESSVATAAFDDTGFGVAPLTPQIQKKYFLKVENENRIYELPPVIADGVGVLLTQNIDQAGCTLKISVPTKSKWRGKKVYLVQTSQNRMVQISSFQISDERPLVIKYSENNLAEGINCFSIIDPDKGLLASRYFNFTKRDNLVVEMQLNSQNILAPRDSMRINVALHEKSGIPLQGKFAMSVYPKKLFPIDARINITDHWGFSEEAHIQYSSLDTYLMTKQNDFPWLEILGSSGRQQDGPYTQSRILKLEGKAFFTTTKEPVPDSTLVMVYLHHQLIGYEVYTKNGGQLEISFFYDFYDEDKLFYAMEWRGKPLENVKLEFKNHVQNTSVAPHYHVTSIDDYYAEYQYRKRLIDRSYSFYSSEKNALLPIAKSVNYDFEEEMDGADLMINIPDYLAFSSMTDLLRVVPTLYHRKQEGKHVVQMRLSNGKLPSESPTLFINGEMTRNINSLMDLNPADIIQLKIVKDVNKLNQLGALGKYGLLLVLTKNGLDFPYHAINSTLNVLGLSKEIAQKKPGVVNPVVPNFRSSIFWNPSIQIVDGRASVLFTASHDVGTIVIHIEGLTSDGREFSHSMDMEIVFRKLSNKLK